MKDCVLVLHNIRSVHNVGSIFRTADAAGVRQIILSGYTPAPVDHYGRERRDFTKVSLGAERSVLWRQVKQLTATLKKLKRDGYTVVATEQHPRSTPLFAYSTPHKKLALVLGNEVRGLSKAALKHSDAILEIPMRGSKESLNVSVAAGIALFSLLKNQLTKKALAVR